MLIRIGNIVIPIQNISNLEKREITVKAELEEWTTEKIWRIYFIDGNHIDCAGPHVPLIDCWVELMAKSGRIMDLGVLYEQKNQISQNIESILGGNGEAQKNTNTNTSKQSVDATLNKLRERLKQKQVENQLREDIDNE